MKFKVLIVEDNKLIREGLVKGIDWDTLGFDVIGEGADGYDGYNLFTICKPDVIITDIKMPQMDGISFLEKVREMDTDVKLIMLSGYKDFDYARKAIKLDIYAYVLKEEINDKFPEILSSLYKNMMEARKNKNSSNEFPIIEDKQRIKEILRGEDKKTAALMLLKNVCAALIWVPDTDFIYKGIIVEKQSETIEIICAIIDGNYCLLILKSIDSTKQIQDYKAFTEFIKNIEDDYIVGIGTIQAMSDSYLSFNQAMKVVDFARFKSEKGIFVYNEMEERLEQGTVLFDENRVLKAVLINGREKLLSIVNNTFESGITAKGVYSEVFQLFGIEILMSLKEVFRNIFKKRGIEDSLLQEIKRFAYINSLVDMKELLIDIIDRYYTIVDTELGNGNEAINTAKAIIDNYYDFPITMNELSEKVYMSLSNFSNQFKKSTGYRFIDYITEKRINAAKVLIDTSDIKIYEICHEVGYSDEKHFFKVFKKQTGLTPLQYKRRVKN